jgi:hypothetical protein
VVSGDKKSNIALNRCDNDVPLNDCNSVLGVGDTQMSALKKVLAAIQNLICGNRSAHQTFHRFQVVNDR